MRKKKVILKLALSAAIVISYTLNAVGAGERIDQEFYIQSDEAQLYIKVRGQDINNPVLLYLHGGPGETYGPLLFQAYAGPELEKHFVVGYLHQRSTCMSPDAPIETLILSKYVEDVGNTVEFLKDKFKKDKISLLGHSFGGGLGYLYLLEHQDNIEKFVSAAGAFSVSSVENSGYQTVLELSKKTGNQEAAKKLEDLGPPPYETLQEGMAWRRIGMEILDKMNEGLGKNLQMSKVITITEIDSIDPGWENKSMVVVKAMYDELKTLDLENRVNTIDVPMLLIAGAKDILVPFSTLEKGYKNYGGQKEYFILQKSNHMMFIDEPDLFVSKVIEFFQR
ncbi:MAG: alpha/beta hydrolase [Gemmatimonadota bacterium]|nr:MAG: alpha/beta hydrolase [Gemmatimonadota bacterium]